MNACRTAVTALVAILIMAGVCGGGASWCLDRLRTYKNPERVFRRHEAELRAYVARLQAGQVPRATGREPDEYCMPQFLIDHGATRAFWSQGRAKIVFFVSPVDAVPQLEYSPTGFQRQEIEHRTQSGSYFRWVPLAHDWAACYWDS
jgi:hypothetical protein